MINLSTGAFFERATRQIGTLRERANELQEQIGSGNRLSRSSDDPVAAARLRTLERRERLADIDQRTSDMVRTDLELTDRALGSMADIVIRAKELALRAANESIGPDQRGLLGTELSSLRESLLLVANSRNGAGHALFGGQAAGMAYEQTNGTITYAGTNSTEEVGIGDGQSVISAFTGPQVLSFTHEGVPTDTFEVLGTLAAALLDPTADHRAAAQDALGALDGSLERVTTSQTITGARMGWIEMLDQRRQATGDLMAEERTEIGGADPATTMVRLQETLTVLEASQASFVRVANLSLFNALR